MLRFLSPPPPPDESGGAAADAAGHDEDAGAVRDTTTEEGRVVLLPPPPPAKGGEPTRAAAVALDSPDGARFRRSSPTTRFRRTWHGAVAQHRLSHHHHAFPFAAGHNAAAGGSSHDRSGSSSRDNRRDSDLSNNNPDQRKRDADGDDDGGGTTTKENGSLGNSTSSRKKKKGKRENVFRRTWHGSHHHRGGGTATTPTAHWWRSSRHDAHGLPNRHDFFHGHGTGSRRRRQQPTSPGGGINVFRATRQGSVRAAQTTQHAFSNLFRSVEEFFFPKSPPFRHAEDNNSSNSHALRTVPKVPGGVLMLECRTEDEHRARVRSCMTKMKGLHSWEGLKSIGLEYRWLPCGAHSAAVAVGAAETSPSADCIPEGENEDASDVSDLLESPADMVAGSISNWMGWSASGTAKSPSSSSSLRQPDVVSTVSTSVRSLCSDDVPSTTDMSLEGQPESDSELLPCMFCMRRLYHIESGTLVTADNRKLYIADGDMYDEVARLCQEYAHECMCREANLRWVTIEDVPRNSESTEHQQDASKRAAKKGEKKKNKQKPADCIPTGPIRVLVNDEHPLVNRSTGNDYVRRETRPCVLIATGRGKVRAGIFSRQNLIATGMEAATALPLVREARHRGLDVILVDPNVHGDRWGFVAFEKTMNFIADRCSGGSDGTASITTAVDDGEEQPRERQQQTGASNLDLLVISHSASGGHLARYLLDRPDDSLSQFRAVAFTDSTHNIQWAKTKDRPALYDYLESDRCVYFRSSEVRENHENSKWYLHSPGEPIKTDTFWQRRFGKIKTYWAGTNEHSMTNWYSHASIWRHFDSFLLDGGNNNSSGNDTGSRSNEDIIGVETMKTGAGGEESDDQVVDPYHNGEFRSRGSSGKVIQL